MKTYTIAVIGDTLAATAVDGDTEMMAGRLADVFASLGDDEKDIFKDKIRYFSGLTLFATEEDARDAGAEIIYSGTVTGWLQDADGKFEYEAAGRLPQ